MNGLLSEPWANGLEMNSESVSSKLQATDIVPFENQVAGHSSANGKSSIGMLKHKDGYVLKPVLKPIHGVREAKFYRDLQLSSDPESVELKSFVPEFLGTSTLNVDDKVVDFLVLKNVTSDFLEPCVMDIKIGKQTWDPEATKEKRVQEDKKYSQSKQELGFCIPGFQVYTLPSGKLVKMKKEYGNSLTKHTTKDAFRLFLNSDSGLSRRLLLQLLVHLWRILGWCRTQHKFRFYSSSLLLVYDAKRLRTYLKNESIPFCRPLSLTTVHASSTHQPKTNSGPFQPGSKFEKELSIQLPPTANTARLPSSPTLPSSVQRQNSLTRSESWHAMFDNVCRTHSLTHNYEKDLQTMKENYSFDLDSLTSTGRRGDKEVWATVKMIDFAHVFPAPCDEVDVNYLEGIENVVHIIESLLKEATC